MPNGSKSMNGCTFATVSSSAKNDFASIDDKNKDALSTIHITKQPTNLTVLINIIPPLNLNKVLTSYICGSLRFLDCAE